MKLSREKKNALVLLNIRSTYNVGAIFRTADAVGIGTIYLVGITPAPVDRFGRERKDIAKSALGAEKTIAWKSVKSFTTLAKGLKKDGYTLVGLEQAPNSIDYKKYVPKEKTALVLGEEVSGFSKKEIDLCDVVLEIPMRGAKESLNVSVAAGIALFQLFDR